LPVTTRRRRAILPLLTLSPRFAFFFFLPLDAFDYHFTRLLMPMFATGTMYAQQTPLIDC